MLAYLKDTSDYFQYYISHGGCTGKDAEETPVDNESQTSPELDTTLDNEQYPGYPPLAASDDPPPLGTETGDKHPVARSEAKPTDIRIVEARSPRRGRA